MVEVTTVLLHVKASEAFLLAEKSVARVDKMPVPAFLVRLRLAEQPFAG
jgi:hypothetical protein